MVFAEQKIARVIEAGKLFPDSQFSGPIARARAIIEYLYREELPLKQRIYISVPSVRKFLCDLSPYAKDKRQTPKPRKKKKASKEKSKLKWQIRRINNIYTNIRQHAFDSEESMLEAISSQFYEAERVRVDQELVKKTLRDKLYRDQARFDPERKQRVIDGFEQGHTHSSELRQYLADFQEDLSLTGMKLCLAEKGYKFDGEYKYTKKSDTKASPGTRGLTAEQVAWINKRHRMYYNNPTALAIRGCMRGKEKAIARYIKKRAKQDPKAWEIDKGFILSDSRIRTVGHPETD